MQVDVSLDRNDFWHYHQFAYLHTKPGRWSLLLYALVAPFVTFILFATNEGLNVTNALVVLGTAVVWWLLLPLLLRYSARRAYKRFPEHFREAAVTIGEEGFIWKGPLATDTMAWPAIQRIRHNRHGIFFYVDANRAFIVPKRAFACPDEAQRFLETAEAYHRQSTVSGQTV